MSRPAPLRDDVFNSVPSVEYFLSEMAKCLVAVGAIQNTALRCTAYEWAGYSSDEIIEYDDECKAREIQRRAIFGMKQMSAMEESQ